MENTFYKTPKNDPRDRIEVEIGDAKQTEFYPQLKIKRWDNEVNASFRLLGDVGTNRKNSGKIKYESAKREAHFYELPVSEDHPEGASELEVILKEKPDTNVIEFSMQTKGLKFDYQPELTQKEKDDGCIRPENMVGSYAIYCSEPKMNYVGGKLYRVNKVGHIPKPKIIDSGGKETWGDLHIEKGLLTVTIPQEFLDNAVYPVKHAAGLTFGYTTKGATSTYSTHDWAHFNEATPASNGDVDSITFWSKYLNGSSYYKGVLWLSSTDVILANGVTDTIVVGWNTDQWFTTTYPTSPAVVGSTAYKVGVMVSVSTKSVLYYDSGGSDDGDDDANDYDSPGDLSTPYRSTAKKYSVYATYTASGVSDAEINVNDAVSVAEDVTVSAPPPDLEVNVNDTVSVAEQILNEVIDYISVAENVSVAEQVLNEVVDFISVAENVSIAEVVSLLIKNFYRSVFDAVSVAEQITSLLTSFLNVNDTVATAEDVTVELPPIEVIEVNVNEAIAVAENVTVSAGIPSIPWLDTFSDNDLDLGLWEESSNAGSLVAEQNNQLELISNANISAYIKSKGLYVPKNTTLITKVTQHSTDGGLKMCPTDPAGHQWDVYSEANWYNFQLIAGPKLSPNKKVAGSASQVGGDSPVLTPPYWMRIRIDDAKIYFDYADQATEPTEGEWINISSETWSLGSSITTGHYVFITSYNTPSTGESHWNNFSWKRFEPSPSINEAISVAELVSADAPPAVLSVNVNEAITVNENVTVVLVHQINVNDAVAVSEDITARLLSFINVNEAITVNENVVASVEAVGAVEVNVFDAVGVAEDVTVRLLLFINVNEAIAVSENVSALLVSLVSVFEGVTAAENVEVDTVLNISVNEAIGVTESVTIRLLSFINVNEAIAVNENVEAVLSIDLSVYDAVSVAENVVARLLSFINVNEAVAANENVAVFIPFYKIDVSEAIGVAENVSVVLANLINAFEAIGVAEDVTMQLLSYVNVNEAVVVAEDVTVELEIKVSVFDTVTVNEDVTILATFLNINVNEAVAVAENSARLLTSFITVFEAVAVNENVDVLIPLEINVNDTVTVAENIEVERLITINVVDAISVAEQIVTFFGYVSVYDAVSVAESITVVLPTLSINVNETITVTENVRRIVSAGPSDTYAVYGETGAWLSFFVDGTEVVRFKPNGDIDVNGVVNENAF